MSTRLRSMTPWSLHADRSPFAGIGAPTSSASSAKMFWSERGTGRTCG
ncbi:Uncharacterised protein [Mycobacteroides abscessus]|nr:Uncharacterised protein [Mycobacteroides abscessus]